MDRKKILILVLSFKDTIYNSFYNIQKNTWDSINHPNIKTIYFFGKKFKLSAPYFKSSIVNNDIVVPLVDTYMGIRKKTVLAFDAIKEYDFDYVLRTNSCSYIDKINLSKFLENKPADNFYFGVRGVYQNIEFISGAGYILSKDLILKIIESKNLFDDSYIDDVSLSIFLNRNKVTFDFSGKRVDIVDTIPDNIIDNYHYRFNTGGNREKDFNNMLKLHEKICLNRKYEKY